MKLADEQVLELRRFLARNKPCLSRLELVESRRIEGEIVEDERDVAGYESVVVFIERGLGGQEELIRQVLSLVASVQNDSHFDYPVRLFSFGWDDGLLHGAGGTRRGGPNVRCDGWVKELCQTAVESAVGRPGFTSLFAPAVSGGAPLKVKREDLLVFFCKGACARLTQEAVSRYAKPLKHAVWLFCNSDRAELATGARGPESASGPDRDYRAQNKTEAEREGRARTGEGYKEWVGELLDKHLSAGDASLKLLVRSLNEPKQSHPSKPGSYLTVIADIGEKAFQRAIMLSGRSKVEGWGDLTWLDIELPVIFSSKSRRPSLDLLGRDEAGRLVLCELKYGDKSKDSPVYALFELLVYYTHIVRNAEALQTSGIWHAKMHKTIPPFDWNTCASPENIRLAVVADDAYWRGRNVVVARQLADEIQKKVLGLTVSFFQASGPQVPFGDQRKKAGGTYMPELGVQSKSVWKLL